MNRDNKKDIEYSMLDTFKEICRLQDLEEKGQVLTPENKIWLEQFFKDLDNTTNLFRRRNTKLDSHYDENGIRILEKGDTVDSCNIFSGSAGKDTWRLLFDVLSQHSEFVDVLRIRTKAYLNRPERGNYGVSIGWDNVLKNDDLGTIPERCFKDAISEIPYNDKTLYEIMASFLKIPSDTRDKLKQHIEDMKVKLISTNETIDEKKIEKLTWHEILQYLDTRSMPADKKKRGYSKVKSISIDAITIDETIDETIETTTKGTRKDLIEHTKDITGDTIEDLEKHEHTRKLIEAIVKMAIEDLSDKEFEIIKIKYLSNVERTNEQIAEMLNITESTATKRINKAIEKIRKTRYKIL